MHAAYHAALCGHICPVNHLLPVVKVQRHGVVQALSKHGSRVSLRRQRTAAVRVRKRTVFICSSDLFDQRVVGSIQVELSEVIPVGKDEEGFLICVARYYL